MAEDIPGLGPCTSQPKPTPHNAVAGLPLKPEDWFLLSRIDGQTDIQSLFLLSPKGEAETIEMLKRLLDADLISLPGFTRTKTTPGVPGRPGVLLEDAAISASRLSLPTDWPTPMERFLFDQALLKMAPSLDEGFKKQLFYVHHQMKQVSYYQLFGVPQDASDREIKAKYLKYSKVFHPDRFFRQDLGPWRELLDDVYRWVNAAFQTLSNDTARRVYDNAIAQPSPPSNPFIARPNTQSTSGTVNTVNPAAFQAQLLEAKRLERDGQLDQALTLYEAALQKRRVPELLIRAAECMIKLRDRLPTAEQYCREAIQQDPTQARFWAALAYILELQGRAADAIQHYTRAVTLDPSNRGAQERLRRLSP
jgi:tetratricopeptide (TPR) repeat protein